VHLEGALDQLRSIQQVRPVLDVLAGRTNYLFLFFQDGLSGHFGGGLRRDSLALAFYPELGLGALGPRVLVHVRLRMLLVDYLHDGSAFGLGRAARV